MSNEGESKWKKEQQEAERLREEARAHLKRKGIAGHNEKPPDHKLARKDNTIALVEARKARQREEVQKAEETLKPFVKRKEQVVKTEQPPSRTQGFEVTPELAAGWTLVDSDALVTPLFVHKSSGCTTVKLPKKSIMDYSERKGLKLPLGWKTLRDNESGRVYYWNSRSGAVQWVQPSSAK